MASLIISSFPYILSQESRQHIQQQQQLHPTLRLGGTRVLDRNKESGGLEVICMSSSFFNALAPRFANIPEGVTPPQLRIISTCPTFVYTPHLSIFCHQPLIHGAALGIAHPNVGPNSLYENNLFVADLIRKRLPYLVSFKADMTANDLIVAALLFSERLETFSFVSNPFADLHLCELLRHRNLQIRHQVLSFYRKSLTTGTMNQSAFVVGGETVGSGAGFGYGGGFSVSNSASAHPLIAVAERGYTNALKMLLEFQDEIIAFREDQIQDRKIENESRQKAFDEAQAQARAYQQQLQQQAQQQPPHFGFGAAPTSQHLLSGTSNQNQGFGLFGAARNAATTAGPPPTAFGGFASPSSTATTTTATSANSTGGFNFGGTTAASTNQPLQAPSTSNVTATTTTGGFSGFGRSAAPPNQNQFVPSAAPLPLTNAGSGFSFAPGASAARPLIGTFGGFGRGAAAFQQPAATPPPLSPSAPLPELNPIRILDAEVLLFHAAEHGRSSCVALLLSMGARVSAYTHNATDRIAIEAAAANGHVECVKLLHEAYVKELEKWNREHPSDGTASEQVACSSTTTTMTAAAAPVPASVLGGPFTGAVAPGRTLAQTELEARARLLQPRMPFRGNALHFGAGLVPLVRYLLVESPTGRDHYKVDELTQVNPASPRLQTGGLAQFSGLARPSFHHASTPLQFATHAGARDSIVFLLEQGANPEYREPGRNSAIQLACIKRDISLLRILIEKGKPSRESQETALVAACRSGSPTIVEYLLKEAKVDPNCIDRSSSADSSGDTPLIACCRGGSCDVRCIRLLLGAGADVNKRSDPEIVYDDDDDHDEDDDNEIEGEEEDKDEENTAKNNNNNNTNNKHDDVVIKKESKNDNDNDDDDVEQQPRQPAKSSSSGDPNIRASSPSTQEKQKTKRTKRNTSTTSVVPRRNVITIPGAPSMNIGTPHQRLSELAKCARITPLAALFSFTFVGAEHASGAPSLPPSNFVSLFTVMKILLFEGKANPNVYLPRAHVRPRKAQVPSGGGGLQAPAAGPVLGLSLALQPTSPVGQDYVLAYEPLLAFLCRTSPARIAHFGFGSPAITDYSFLQLLLDAPSPTGKLDANLPCFGFKGFTSEGMTSMHYAAMSVVESQYFERLVNECGGDILKKKDRLSRSEKNQLMKKYGTRLSSSVRGDKRKNKAKKSNQTKSRNKELDDDYVDDGDLGSTSSFSSSSSDDDDDDNNSNVVRFEHASNNRDRETLNETPFRIAIRYVNVEAATVMLQRLGKEKVMEVERREVTKELKSPYMHLVVSDAHVTRGNCRIADFLRLLRQYGADPDLPSPINKRTLLNIACSSRAGAINEYELARNMRQLCGATRLKIRREEEEYATVLSAASDAKKIMDEYAAAVEENIKSGRPIPRQLSTRRAQQMSGSDIVFGGGLGAGGAATGTFAGMHPHDRTRRFGFGGGDGALQFGYSMSRDKYPALRDFYTVFLCSSCDKDMILNRGSRRFCAGCFFILCSDCLNEEKSKTKVVDVEDGEEKDVLLCSKCREVMCDDE